MMTSSKATWDVLTEAAEIVAGAPKLARGEFWVASRWLDEDGFSILDGEEPPDVDTDDDRSCYCIVGAIRKAVGTPDGNVYAARDIDGAAQAVCEFLKLSWDEEFGDPQTALYGWNDDSLTTKDMVVAALRGAALHEREWAGV